MEIKVEIGIPLSGTGIFSKKETLKMFACLDFSNGTIKRQSTNVRLINGRNAKK